MKIAPVFHLPGKIDLFIIIGLILLFSGGCLNKQTTTWKEYLDAAVVEKSLDLHYETYGRGDPIIFLHGLGGNLYMWRHLIKPLENSHRLILFDLKGFGKSPKPYDDKYSMFDQAELIYRFILQNDLRNLTLIGHSFGGGVALLVTLKLAEQEPQRLSRLILIDTVAYPQKLPGVLKMLRLPLLGTLGLYLIPDRIKVRQMLELIYFDDRKITPEDVEAYAAPLSLPGAKYALQQSARQIIPDNLAELIALYPRIKVPTLIIWGREDKVIPRENAVRLQQALSNAQLAIIDRSGHDPHEERPEAVLEAMRKFLGDPDQPRPHP